MPDRKTSKGGQFTDRERQELKRLHAQGKTRNDIATLMKRSPRTISMYAERLGLAFDRTATAAATEARKMDFKARRAAIIEKLYGVVEDDLTYLAPGQKYELIEVSSGTAVGYEPKRLPAQDRRALVQSVSAAMTAAARLEAVDGDPGVDAARSMLGSLDEAIRKVAGLDAGEDDTGEG